MFGLGFQEVLVIMIFALLIFGAAKLPEIGRSLGKALSEFKKGMTDSPADRPDPDKTDKPDETKA